MKLFILLSIILLVSSITLKTFDGKTCSGEPRDTIEMNNNECKIIFSLFGYSISSQASCTFDGSVQFKTCSGDDSCGCEFDEEDKIKNGVCIASENQDFSHRYDGCFDYQTTLIVSSIGVGAISFVLILVVIGIVIGVALGGAGGIKRILNKI